MKKNKLGGKCSTYGGGKTCTQDLVEIPKGKRQFGRSIFSQEDYIRMNLQEDEKGAWTGLKWL